MYNDFKIKGFLILIMYFVKWWFKSMFDNILFIVILSFIFRVLNLVKVKMNLIKFFNK